MSDVVSARTSPDEALDRAAVVLQAGGTVVLPTDTVYGVAALPGVAGATDALFRLKDRAGGQPLAVLVADAAQARALVDPLAVTAEVARWMDRLWPGADGAGRAIAQLDEELYPLVGRRGQQRRQRRGRADQRADRRLDPQR